MVLVMLLYACGEKADTAPALSVHEVMDSVITRLYAQVPAAQFDSIGSGAKKLVAVPSAVMSPRASLWV